MKNILWISMMLPYKTVGHAGGKSFNYYINRFANDENYNVTLIAKVLPEEKEHIKDINSNICFLPVATPENGIQRVWCYVKSANSKLNPFYPYGNVLTKEIYDQIEDRLYELKRDDYRPDIIILEWTWMMLWIDNVKKYFPNAKYVATEHDVSFLGYYRKWVTEKNVLKKLKKYLRYVNVKKREICAAQKCDYVLALNEKDRNLLLKNEVNKTRVGTLTPFFEKPKSIDRKPNRKDIIFYGAMGRAENAISAKWFVENVMPLISDLNVRFLIVGSNPPDEIKSLQSEDICVTGFVNDVVPYFETSMCMVAPLQLGAGIKIKVLEGLAMGIPVLTNEIGIEGIDAKDGKEYLFCKSPEEYADSIRKIVNGTINTDLLSQNAMDFIKKHFDFQKSYEEYSARLKKLCDNNLY